MRSEVVAVIGSIFLTLTSCAAAVPPTPNRTARLSTVWLNIPTRRGGSFVIEAGAVSDLCTDNGFGGSDKGLMEYVVPKTQGASPDFILARIPTQGYAPRLNEPATGKITGDSTIEFALLGQLESICASSN